MGYKIMSHGSPIFKSANTILFTRKSRDDTKKAIDGLRPEQDEEISAAIRRSRGDPVAIGKIHLHYVV